MISVVVVAYRSAEIIGACLDSVLPLAEAGAEVIVVDNASDDGTSALVGDRYSFCRLIELEENLGFGAANNRAVAASSGDRILLLNPDARLEGAAAGQLSEELDRDRGLGVVVPTLRFPEGGPQFNWAPTTSIWGEYVQTIRNRFESRSWAHRPTAALLQTLGNRGWCSAACCMVRRAAWGDVGGFDERFFLYFEDTDLCVRLRRAGWRLGEVSAARAVHARGTATGAETDKVEYQRSHLAYYRKHRPAWENRVLRRRLRSRFEAEADAEYRSALLGVLDEEHGADR